MQTKLNSRALLIVDQALRGGPWRESTWDDRSRRFGVAMLDTLRDTLTSGHGMGHGMGQGISAVAAGYSAGRAALPLASAAWQETWGRVVLVWAIRGVTRAAHASADVALREELLRQAAELGVASGQLGSAETSPTVLGAPAPFEQMVDAARDALVNAREGMALETVEGGFLAAYLQQLKHIVSLLAVGGHSVDSLVRGAVARTDRVVRKDGHTAWVDAGLSTRQTWAQRGLVEAGWALAVHVPRAQDRVENSREVSLWLARTACALAVRVDRVAQWVPTVPEDAARERTPAVTTVDTPGMMPSREGAEARMDNKTNPLLKTLETDAGDAAWRLAGSQFVKLAREPIVALLSRHLAPGDDSTRARIAAFLETELGAALLAGVLSAGLTALPLPGNDMPQKLSRELRVRSMAGAGDVLADVLMGPLRQVAVLYLQGTPGGSDISVNPSGREPAALSGPQGAVASAVESLVTQARVPSTG